MAAVEAQALLQDAQLPVDIALINATGDSGFALANWMRAYHPDIEIILAGTVTNAVKKAGELCADGLVVNKPYDHQTILDQIKQFLAKPAKSNN